MQLWLFAMVNYSRSLIHLCECFRGSVPKNVDWMSLLGLANQTLTTPALMDFTTRFEEQLPEDVCLYVREIFERNLIRNDRLAAQLIEAVVAMNERGVTPILLKGAAILTKESRLQRGTKIMSDLDIMVAPQEVEPALDRLFALGYCVHFQTRPGAEKRYADLKRPSDVGMIDLHEQPPGPAFFYRASDDIKQHCKLIPVGRGSAYVPSPTYQALMLTVHDQFQDSDYWTGNIDVRHLLAMRDLVNLPEGVNWDELSFLTSSRLARNALETQLITLSSLLGVDVPARLLKRFVPRLQYRRRLAQAQFPALRQALLIVALLDYRNYRSGVGASRVDEVEYRRWRLPKLDTLRFLQRLSREHRVGKV
jgi:hypothetical protein